MNQTADQPFDVVVVGAGMTGSVAALFAAELGCRVLLLDACEDSAAGGNSTLAGGAFHLARHSYEEDPAVLRELMLTRAILPRIELIDVVAGTAGEGMAWLRTQGLKFEAEPGGDLKVMLSPLRDLGDVHAWRDRGPHVALKQLQANLRAKGGEVMGGTRAVELARGPGGEISGVVTEDGKTLRANAVMLSDGGFQANLELRKRFIAPNADRMFLRGAPYSMGNGLMMAESAGAKLLNTEWFYGHLLHRDVFENDKLWPWPGLDEVLFQGAILVEDTTGRRFVDEGRGPGIITNAVGQLNDPRGITMILDETVWAGASGEHIWGHRAANPELLDRGGRAFYADTPEELAAQAGIDPEGLKRTLVYYNTAAENGKADNLPVARSLIRPGDSVLPFKGRLMAIPGTGAISHTMGGAMVDAKMHVLDQDEQPIPRLYAAGPGTAGPTVGYHGGFSACVTLGRQAARSIAAERASVS